MQVNAKQYISAEPQLPIHSIQKLLAAGPDEH